MQTNDLLIGCDVDGVIADCGSAILAHNIAAGRIPSGATMDDCTDFSFKTVWPGADFSCLSEVNFWSSLDPLPGARAFVEELRSLGRVVFVSACSAEEERSSWLERHGFSSDGYVDIPAALKSDFAREMGFDIFIEDKPDTLIALKSIVRGVYGVRWKYNLHLEGDVFLGSHREILDKIRSDILSWTKNSAPDLSAVA